MPISGLLRAARDGRNCPTSWSRSTRSPSTGPGRGRLHLREIPPDLGARSSTRPAGWWARSPSMTSSTSSRKRTARTSCAWPACRDEDRGSSASSEIVRGRVPWLAINLVTAVLGASRDRLVRGHDPADRRPGHPDADRLGHRRQCRHPGPDRDRARAGDARAEQLPTPRAPSAASWSSACANGLILAPLIGRRGRVLVPDETGAVGWSSARPWC